MIISKNAEIKKSLTIQHPFMTKTLKKLLENKTAFKTASHISLDTSPETTNPR